MYLSRATLRQIRHTVTFRTGWLIFCDQWSYCNCIPLLVPWDDFLNSNKKK